MDIKTAIAAQSYAQARPVTAAAPEAGGFGQNAVGTAAKEFLATMRAGEDLAKAAMSGGVDPHALVQALAATELAIETAVTVRDKVVEAYQEILRMPV
jgi:flagellar hook-basal body complex protein FliE